MSRAVLRHQASRAYNLARARGLTAGGILLACQIRASSARSTEARALLHAIAARAEAES